MKWHLQLKIKIQNQYLELIKFLNLKSILILIILIIKIANYNQKHWRKIKIWWITEIKIELENKEIAKENKRVE